MNQDIIPYEVTGNVPGLHPEADRLTVHNVQVIGGLSGRAFLHPIVGVVVTDADAIPTSSTVNIMQDTELRDA